MSLYDIHNPTKARRVIFSGIKGKNERTPISVESGETKTNVELADLVVEDLRSRTASDKDGDLIVTDAKQTQSRDRKSAAA